MATCKVQGEPTYLLELSYKEAEFLERMLGGISRSMLDEMEGVSGDDFDCVFDVYGALAGQLSVDSGTQKGC